MADGKVGPQSGSGENHPRRAAVFSPETLPFRSIRRKALVVQRAEMPGIHNLKKQKNHATVNLYKAVTDPDAEARDTETGTACT